MTEAHSPAKLSAPTSASSVLYAAVEALPEKGRVTSKGNSSGGSPSFSAAGARSSERKFTAPDAFSIATATISATMVGSSLTAVCKPSEAPAVNAEK